MRKLIIERGYDKETVAEVFMLLVEEVGELGKAIRKDSGLKVGDHSKHHELAHELADVFWLVIDLTNRLDLDLAQAFLEKEAINQQRAHRPEL
ncbi:MAG: MazG nucleotide pyrophosphohydrolase domain-containing protein [Candidatus Saccharimonadales bacterium]